MTVYSWKDMDMETCSDVRKQIPLVSSSVLSELQLSWIHSILYTSSDPRETSQTEVTDNCGRYLESMLMDKQDRFPQKRKESNQNYQRYLR